MPGVGCELIKCDMYGCLQFVIGVALKVNGMVSSYVNKKEASSGWFALFCWLLSW